jgi:hypothetical protein
MPNGGLKKKRETHDNPRKNGPNSFAFYFPPFSTPHEKEA